VREQALGASIGQVSLAPAHQQEIPLPLDEHGRFWPGISSNLGAYSFIQNGTGLSEAPATTIDALGFDHVAFIKVDVQGADGTVLLGGMNTIAHHRPWVVFEWEQELSVPFGVTFDEVASRLRSANYVLHMLYRHNHKQVDYIAVPKEEDFALPRELAPPTSGVT
jgi:Methyltransferase FkbM domain